MLVSQCDFRDLAVEQQGCPARRRHLADPLRAVTWGDDYELLFAAPADFVPPVPAARIGEMAPAGRTSLLLDGQVPEIALGYQHR